MTDVLEATATEVEEAPPVQTASVAAGITGDQLVQAIYDGVGNPVFDELVAAMQHVLKQANSQVVWRFEWENRVFDKRKIGLNVWRHWQTITGQSYTVCHPDNADHARALIAAQLIVEGVKTDEAFDRADNAAGWDVAYSKTEEAVPGAPFDTTSTSA